ncbi:thiamine pyrophosphate-dependent enzyme [Dankookia sp. P2]|uniref:thiamine pyrophosphate-dependent enzyme n=1 Tax=Dankookia sp. P2 TaxID=3423955 RepID=UPI003D6652AD
MADNTHRMNRFDLMQRMVARLRQEEAVIGGIGHTNFDLWSAGHRPQNFYMLGSMGLAVPIALGVALAQPQRRVFALEGDGSILMQLGCLATVATLRPKNLTILVMDNGSYQITGGQPTPAAGSADYVAIARGCGLANSVWAKDETDFERLVEASLAGEGPNLIGLKLDDAKPPTQTERDPAQIRDRFMRGMGAKTSKLPG